MWSVVNHPWTVLIIIRRPLKGSFGTGSRKGGTLELSFDCSELVQTLIGEELNSNTGTGRRSRGSCSVTLTEIYVPYPYTFSFTRGYNNELPGRGKSFLSSGLFSGAITPVTSDKSSLE